MSFIEYIKYIFPILAALLVLWTARCWLPVFGEELPDAQPEAPKKRLSFRAPRGRLTRKDALCAALITLAYTVFAFMGLGDRAAPESYCHFIYRGQYAVIDLDEARDIGSMRYFSGLGTNEYRVELSMDGESFWDAGSLEQSYAMLFKWNSFTPEEGAETKAKFIRVTAGADMRLGELAIYDREGNMLDASRFSFEEGVRPLFDEQELVPAASSFMNSSYFDEIYHARTAYEHIEDVNPYEITHPPLGKLIIGIGIRLFGMTPFGWRFSGTLFGVLMLPLLYVFIKCMLGSTAIASCGTLIFAFDFMHFVQTRIATIDTYSVFFIILMYLFMWLYVSGGSLGALALSGICFGLGAASKWTCIYAGAGLGVIWLWHWITRRGEVEFWRKLALNCLFCVVFFVILPLCIYYASYYPYGTAKGLNGGVSMYFTRDYADTVWQNQVYMWEYHSGLVSEHPYSSRWYQWLADARPILYYLEYFDDSTKSAFGAFMNPIFCWGGFFAVAGCAVLAVKDRDGRALFIVLGYLAQLLPWVLVSRLTFAYHYFPSSVFMLLALCYMFGRMRELALPNYRASLYSFTAVSTALFAVFYPVLSGLRVPTAYTSFFCKWFPSWPF